MEKKLTCSSYEITIDKENSRFFLLCTKTIKVYDIETLQKITILKDISNPNQICISYKNGIIIVKSTAGEFAVYSLKELELLGKIVMGGETDCRFCYDEEHNMIYGIVLPEWDKNPDVVQYWYCLSPETFKYSDKHTLAEFRGVSKKELGLYEIYKYSQGSVYMLRNYYDKNKRKWCGDCDRYEMDGDVLIYKETIKHEEDFHLYIYDMTESETFRRFYKLFEDKNMNGGFIVGRMCESGMYYVTINAVYHAKENGEFEEIYSGQYVSDYAEYNGRRYICTWNYCLVQDM